MRHLCAVIVTTLVVTSNMAYGDLVGATINVSAYFPNTQTVESDPGDVVVLGGVEYPQGSFPEYNDLWSVDVTRSKLIINWGSQSGNFADADFNGFILEVIDGPTIIAASTNSSSDFLPVDISTTPNKVLVNFAGLDFTGQQVVIDIYSGNPAPVTCWGWNEYGQSTVPQAIVFDFEPEFDETFCDS